MNATVNATTNAADTLWAVMPHAQTDTALWLILGFPLLGAVICGLLGRSLERACARALGTTRGSRIVPGIAIAAMLAATAAAIRAVMRLQSLPQEDRLLIDHLFTLLSVERLHVDVALAFDPLAAVFALVITVVGTLIHVYAVGYMHGDPGRWRFFACLNLFVFAMLLLVLADSLLLSFVGWEGVGLCSYLLIGFWHRTPGNGDAARKAFLYNRVGDWGFVAGMLLLVATFSGALPLGVTGAELSRRLGPAQSVGQAVLVAPIPHVDAPTSVPAHLAVPLGPTLRLRELAAFARAQDAEGRPIVAEALAGARLWGVPLVLLIGLAFFLAMSGKSAQLPLSLWLPDAMAGPTPVSALIHAATMVTAGVYLAARLSFLFVLSPALGTWVAVVGLSTAFVAALLALVQQDIKKVLAYSTISQLGFMFLAIGAGAPGAAVFHVVTHACFKACLFLAAGSVIHAQATLRSQGAPAAEISSARVRTREQQRRQADPDDPQDMRNYRGLRALLPRTRVAYLVGAAALAGLPLASGFFSKDEILWRALTAGRLLVPGWVFYTAALLTAGLTAFYSARSYYLVFARDEQGGGPATQDAIEARPAHASGVAHVSAAFHAAHEAPVMLVPVLLLAVAAIVVGPLLGWPEAWGGHPLLEGYLAPVLPVVLPDVLPAHTGAAHAITGLPPVTPSHAAARIAQLAGVLVAGAGWFSARTLYRRTSGGASGLASRLRARWDRLHRLLWNGLFLDELARGVAVHPTQDATAAADALDRRFVDGVVRCVGRVAVALAALGAGVDRYLVDGLVRGLGHAALWSGRRLQRAQTGRLNHYTLGITLGAALLVVVAWMVR